MLAAVLTGHGGPEVLTVRDDVPVRAPGPGEVLVEVRAAAVNNTDLWTREGAYGDAHDPSKVAGWRGVPISFPRIQGGDVAGMIVEVGPDVDPARRGQRVLVDPARYGGAGGATPEEILGSEFDGGFAQYLTVAAEQAHDVTDAPLSDVELACLPIAYGTAMGMLERAEVARGESVVVTGASGGVGSALVQLADARGARVIAVTGAATAAAVRAAGAAVVVPRDQPNVAGRVRDAAGGPVDVVADVVGGRMFGELFPVLATGGRWVVCGAVAGPVVELDLRQLYLHQRRLIGSTMHTPAQFRQLVDEARRGTIRPVVARTYPLAEIHTAQAELRAGELHGKLVLLPS